MMALSGVSGGAGWGWGWWSRECTRIPVKEYLVEKNTHISVLQNNAIFGDERKLFFL